MHGGLDPVVRMKHRDSAAQDRSENALSRCVAAVEVEAAYLQNVCLAGLNVIWVLPVYLQLAGYMLVYLAPVVSALVYSVSAPVLIGCTDLPNTGVVRQVRRDALAAAPARAPLQPLSPLAEHRHGVPVPAVPVLAHSVAALILTGILHPRCVAGADPVLVAAQIAPSASDQEKCSVEKGCAEAELLRGQSHRQPLPPAPRQHSPRWPRSHAALHCHSLLLQISVPSGAARRRLPDVFRVCPFFGLIVLECLE